MHSTSIEDKTIIGCFLSIVPQNWPNDNYKNITSCWILRVGITNLIRISPSFKRLWIACEGSNIFYSSGKLVYWRYCMTKSTHPNVEDYHLPWIGANDLWSMQGLSMWKWLNIAKFQLHWNKVLVHSLFLFQCLGCHWFWIFYTYFKWGINMFTIFHIKHGKNISDIFVLK
jgi:hypothetical protein